MVVGMNDFVHFSASPTILFTFLLNIFQLALCLSGVSIECYFMWETHNTCLWRTMYLVYSFALLLKLNKMNK